MKEFFMSHVYFLVTETKKGKSTDPPTLEHMNLSFSLMGYKSLS